MADLSAPGNQVPPAAVQPERMQSDGPRWRAPTEMEAMRSLSLTLLGLSALAPFHVPPPPPNTGFRIGSTDTIRYRVSVVPDTAVFRVAVRFHAGRTFQLHMPTFTPGGLTENHARYVVAFGAHDAFGKSIRHRRTGPDAWTIEAADADVAVVEYDVLPNDRDEIGTVTNALRPDGGFFHGTTLFVYDPAQRRAPAELELDLPPGWRVASPLTRSGDGTFRVNGYDELALAPVELGRFSDRVVETAGPRVRMVFDRELPAYDTAGVDRMVHDIVGSHVGLFEKAPFDELLILFHWRPDLDYGGGVARPRVVVMNIGREWMEDLPGNLAGTLAHELMHVWNGTTPGLGGFGPVDHHEIDFDGPDASGFGWFIEGASNYYVYLTFARLGRLPPERLLAILAGDVTQLEGSPGRASVSLSEAEAVSWIDGKEWVAWRAGGSVVAFLLDVSIRLASGGRRSLDDVMRALAEASRRPGYVGYDREDLVGALSAAAGQSMEGLYAELVETPGPIDYAEVLRESGFAVRRTEATEGASYELATTDAAGRALLEALASRPSPFRSKRESG